MILSIETSTSNCSVALHSADGVLFQLKELNAQNIHASQLFVFIEQIMKDNCLSYAQLSAIAVGKGPGSYTGLRIGVSAAKGLCYSLDIPLISINTLLSKAYSAKQLISDPDAFIIPMLDARRMEVYNAIYDMLLSEINATTATIVDSLSYAAWNSRPCYFLGDGMPKCKEILAAQSNAYFIDNIMPSASAIGALASRKFLAKEFENTAYFEPYYLKEFVSQSAFHKK